MSAPRHTTAALAEPATVFDLRAAAQVLTDAAAKAGAAIMAHYGATDEIDYKEDNSPVTQADRDANDILEAALRDFAPSIPVVSEETATDRKAPLGRTFFLVDPLDGTKEFIKKRSDFTVNVGLIEDGFPCFGMVYAPARGLLAVTVADGVAIEASMPPSAAGADLDVLTQKRLHARAADPGAVTALVSLSHLDAKTEEFLERFSVAERSGAGSSVKFLEIARGNADVYPRLAPTMEWDTAAGQAVLEAAGGHVVDMKGARFAYGKSDAGLKNGSFVAWGRTVLTPR
ncbi:3'(2'),5'-bisphosphate nucleotidase CysQ [Methyloceanibacter stevinii]|uniref:3'(2'),5'-bisphosphate nucleotidase CysQ n=1 Tax=Methyloceanibacter stevinii TaxID=1774970 RepID=UPI000AEC6A59|nr:3'(2'),5'-bisphosphate nucleotidase CysQ [Methyloceanibacter stevinii]